MIPGGTERHAFPETKWTLVREAQNGASTAFRDRALTELCRLYWRPIYSFIRLRGHTPHDAEDLTQDFFVRFLGRDDIAVLDAAKGRLRSYLITAVKHHLFGEYRRESRQKRGGSLKALSIDTAEVERTLRLTDLKGGLAPEQVFDRQWALTLLDQAVQTLADHYEQEGRGDLFLCLQDFIDPAAERPRGSVLAERLGMSEEAFRAAIHRFRRRYRECLGAAVRQTLAPGEDAEEELRQLMACFS